MYRLLFLFLVANGQTVVNDHYFKNNCEYFLIPSQNCQVFKWHLSDCLPWKTKDCDYYVTQGLCAIFDCSVRLHLKLNILQIFQN